MNGTQSRTLVSPWIHWTYCGMPERHLSGWSDINQWKNQAHSLSCYGVALVWRHQSVTHSASTKISLNNFSKFYGNVLKAFQVDLKAWFYLTNTAPSSSGKIEAGFRVILLCGPCLLLRHPYYEPLLWFMMNSHNRGVVSIGTPRTKCMWSNVHIVLHICMPLLNLHELSKWRIYVSPLVGSLWGSENQRSIKTYDTSGI